MFTSLSSHDEPYRVSHRDNRGVPTLLSPWEYLEDYGIVHPSGCDVCSSYMKHVADASYSSHQPAFQIAFQDRKRSREDVFNKGISEGIRRQKEENRVLLDDLEHYRCERNQARDELCTLRAQLEVSRADSQRLQDQLRQQTVPPVDVSSSVESVSRHSSTKSAQVDPPPSDPPCSTEAQVTNPPDHQLSLDFLAPLYPQQISPPMTTPASPQAQLPDCVAARSFAAVLATGQPSSDDDPAFHTSDDSPTSLGWTVVAPSAYKPTKPAKSIKHVQSLIKAAHQPGNYSALTKVKALCSEAHKTPRDQKTEVQRYLLSNWRTPDWEHPSSLPKLSAPLNNPRLEDPVECWVSYYTANPSSCPKGIRREADGRPVVCDMKASRTVARLRPLVHPSDPESREARQKYMAVVTELFSEPGEYSNILRRGAFSVSPHVCYAPFVGMADSIDKLSIARHFAACGVTIPMADDELGPWAQEYLRDT
ncbi:uncharacterized protein EDB91DRAFT_1173087 [Suillus paluster]|uniref:uncharacterized protein n=1 Tax=Suillus paluster TaxID=48578 RepID=UPI001B86C4D6|nr:uncharacterized protein EDB91DRAFT_1173087 [Suillus paluster]KAG1723367.1 hypothetical protein EDB91DRAFT_1173087 [Suillus paluster]